MQKSQGSRPGGINKNLPTMLRGSEKEDSESAISANGESDLGDGQSETMNEQEGGAERGFRGIGSRWAGDFYHMVGM